MIVEYQSCQQNFAKVLTDILCPGAGDDEGAAAGLLRHAVVVHLPVEGLPVLLPSVAENIAEFKYFKYLNILQAAAELFMWPRIGTQNC